MRLQTLAITLAALLPAAASAAEPTLPQLRAYT
ncbi:subclass B3 metallo-beta-lactamase, partial [Stenotrophomonas sp. HMWF022]